MDMIRKYTRIDSLTSLRFFAALGVFLHHMGIFNSVENENIKNMAKYFFNGYVGVTFFYILSGFIINYSYNNHLAGKRFDIKDFLFFRFTRIIPVHLFTLIVFIFLFNKLSELPEMLSVLAANGMLVHSLIPSSTYYFSFNAVSWSISCELFFYVSFCGLILLSSRTLAVLLSFIIAIQIIFIIYPLPVISAHWLFYINPFFRVSDFIIGMLFCRWYCSNQYTPGVNLSSFLELLSIALLGVTIFIATNNVQNMNVRYDLLFIIPMLIILIVFSFNNGVISKLLSCRPFVFLGEASFAFYMIHLMVINKLPEFLTITSTNINSVLVYAFAAFIISLTLASFVFIFIEKPINKYARSVWISYRYGKLS